MYIYVYTYFLTTPGFREITPRGARSVSGSFRGALEIEKRVSTLVDGPREWWRSRDSATKPFEAEWRKERADVSRIFLFFLLLLLLLFTLFQLRPLPRNETTGGGYLPVTDVLGIVRGWNSARGSESERYPLSLPVSSPLRRNVVLRIISIFTTLLFGEARREIRVRFEPRGRCYILGNHEIPPRILSLSARLTGSPPLRVIIDFLIDQSREENDDGFEACFPGEFTRVLRSVVEKLVSPRHHVGFFDPPRGQRPRAGARNFF